MKIGVIRQRYVASGGAERYLNVIIQELAARGYRIEVFAHSWAGGDAPQTRFNRVPRVGGLGFLRALSFALSSRRLVARSACDLVMSFERTLRQDVYWAGDGCHREWLAQRRTYVPAWKRGSLALNPLHLVLLGLERRTLSPQCTGWIISNSHRGKEEIIRHFGFPGDRIEVIPNGVDNERFRPPEKLRALGCFDLLFVGTGFERKGLGFCVQALAKLPPEVRLKVVGKGNAAPYRRLAGRLGVLSRLEFLGYNLDTALVYPNADLLVHPAIYEPSANVCLEALACGLPVVTSRINGASELLEHGRNGAIIENPADIDELARGISLFLDRRKLASASLDARNTAEDYPYSRNVSQTLQVLLRALQAKS